MLRRGRSQPAQRPDDVRINLVEAAIHPGGLVEGVVCSLPDQAAGPFRLQYRCEETCRRVFLPDSKYLNNFVHGNKRVRSRLVASEQLELQQGRDGLAVFQLTLPPFAPPNFIGVHEASSHTLVYASNHAVSVLDGSGKTLARTWVNVVPEDAPEAASAPSVRHMSRSLPVLPRIHMKCVSGSGLCV
jgi:hypothetical protein